MKITKKSEIMFKISKNATEAIICHNAPVPVNMKGKSKTFIYAESGALTRKMEKENEINEICDNNFSLDSMSIMLRLPDTKELRNLDTMRYEVKKFIERINQRYENFMYIATIATRFNGEPCCLMFCNLESYIKERELLEIWHGAVYQEKVYSMESFTEIKEYILKNVQYNGQKGYMCSKNVKRDIIIDSGHPEHEYLLNEFTRELADGRFEIVESYQIFFGAAVDLKNMSTGKIVTELLLKQELTEKLKKEGYYELISKFNVYHMRESFPEKFHITTAKPRRRY